MRKKIIVIVLSSIFSIVILNIFCLCYSYTGVHKTSKDGATDYVWESKQFISKFTEGYSITFMDNNGYNNLFDLDKNNDYVDVLLLGSSHMEAVNVDQHSNIGYLLNQYFVDKKIYNIGVSGHEIYHCINNLDRALSTYNTREYVFIETDRIKLDNHKMLNVINNKLEKYESFDSGVIYFLSKYVPSVKAIYINLSSWMKLDKKNGIDKLETLDNNMLLEYEDILNQFLAKAGQVAAKHNVKMIIFYHPTTGYNEQGNLILGTDEKYLELFAEACANNGIKFVDMSEPFTRLYEEQHILAHGFSNSAVGVGHLNEYGHEVIAKELADIIKKEGEI